MHHENPSKHKFPYLILINYQNQVKFFNVIMPSPEFVLAYHFLVRLDSDTYYRSENRHGDCTHKEKFKANSFMCGNYRGSIVSRSRGR